MTWEWVIRQQWLPALRTSPSVAPPERTAGIRGGGDWWWWCVRKRLDMRPGRTAGREGGGVGIGSGGSGGGGGGGGGGVSEGG